MNRLQKAEQEVAAFNTRFSVGDEIIVVLDGDGTKHTHTKIRHEATVMGGHTAVGWAEGISGAYLLSRFVDVSEFECCHVGCNPFTIPPTQESFKVGDTVEVIPDLLHEIDYTIKPSVGRAYVIRSIFASGLCSINDGRIHIEQRHIRKVETAAMPA